MSTAQTKNSPHSVRSTRSKKTDKPPSSTLELDYVKLKGGDTDKMLLNKYAYKITDAIKDTIKGTVDTDPVAKQYIPQLDELKILPEERIDPIGDDVHSPIKGIVHRYPDRVLFKIASVCAVYCRYCFRREMVGPGAGVISTQERTDALNYIRDHPEIWEVILTGGDPLVLAPRQLKETIDQLIDVQHVQVLRIHTRIPIAAPDKITDELCAALTTDKPIYIALHINHAQEITPAVKTALKKLRATGCILLSQSVLLKGVNDNADTLETLFRALITLGVKPYYLHHPDLAPGTSHFRLPIKTGQRIMRELLGRVSGICQPQYMLDIPGGAGKTPINPHYLKELEDGTYIVESYEGEKHAYKDSA